MQVIAGTDSPGYFDGQGTFAQFEMPVSVAIRDANTVLVVDSQRHVIRAITRTASNAPGPVQLPATTSPVMRLTVYAVTFIVVLLFLTGGTLFHVLAPKHCRRRSVREMLAIAAARLFRFLRWRSRPRYDTLPPAPPSGYLETPF